MLALDRVPAGTVQVRPSLYANSRTSFLKMT